MMINKYTIQELQYAFFDLNSGKIITYINIMNGIKMLAS